MTHEDQHYFAHITDTMTGETRICDMGDILWGEGSDYWWGQGNFSCDCNRSMKYFGDEIDDEVSCNHEDNRFHAKCVDDSGEVLYEDDVS